MKTHDLGSHRPRSNLYHFENNPNKQCDVQRYGCPTCWYHCRKSIEKMAADIIKEHKPVELEVIEFGSSGDEEEEDQLGGDSQNDTPSIIKQEKEQEEEEEERASSVGSITSATQKDRDQYLFQDFYKKMHELEPIFKQQKQRKS